MARNIILSGGVGHDFGATSAALAELLTPLGVESTIVAPADWEHALRNLDGAELVTVNALRWTMGAERYAAQREEHRYRTTVALRTALDAQLAEGRALLSLHTGCICFDDWPGWGALLGAAWSWDRSYHPAISDEVEVHDTIRNDRFMLTDELYHALRVTSGRDVLAAATLPVGLPPLHMPTSGDGRTGISQSVLWRSHHGLGRVVVDTLGHGPESLRHPQHARMLVAAVDWALSHQILP